SRVTRLSMNFDLEQTDALLNTTRAVRKRLDFERHVPDELILRCIELAEQAPSGGDISSRRWLVVRDQEIKKQLADFYRAAGGSSIIETAEQRSGSDHPKQKVLESAAHLAANLDRVPALVLATVWGVHDGSGKPGLFDSVIQAAWSFCLALRSRGLGSTWTTMHLGKSKEIAELLGIPEGVSQVVLLPVAWTIGTDFKPATRRPVSEVVWFDRWGYTKEQSGEVNSLIAAGPGVTVEIDIAAPPERVWEFTSDINISARFSKEFQGADWIDSDGPKEGALFQGRNRRTDVNREWETRSWVVECDAPNVFAWNVNDRDEPSAKWRFELEKIPGGTRLRQRFILGQRLSATGTAMVENPEQAEQILASRQEQHRGNMMLNLRGIKELAEQGS
ncbi:MAG: nitroreductase family protein, partial [Chloroflexota bacterium]|nr:nitroreductase family protein [Chloroflexota bacterium]